MVPSDTLFVPGITENLLLVTRVVVPSLLLYTRTPVLSSHSIQRLWSPSYRTPSRPPSKLSLFYLRNSSSVLGLTFPTSFSTFLHSGSWTSCALIDFIKFLLPTLLFTSKNRDLFNKDEINLSDVLTSVSLVSSPKVLPLLFHSLLKRKETSEIL